jgi:hypothetical protein
MTYEDCKEKISLLLSDPARLALLEEEFGDIEEVFVASSDFLEMTSDFEMICENEFDLPENMLTSKKKDYALYIFTDEDEVVQVPKDLL